MSKNTSHIAYKSVFTVEREFIPPNSLQRYEEDIYLRMTVKINGESFSLAKNIIDKIKANHLPLTQNLPSLIHDYIKDKIADLIDDKFIDYLHSLESNSIKSRTLGAILYEQKVPFGKQGDFIRAVIIDNQPKNTSDEQFRLNTSFETSMSCPNPYCYLLGQFSYKGKDGKTDYYCPKCKTTYHWITITEIRE